MTTKIEMSLENQSWCYESSGEVLNYFSAGEQFTADSLHSFLHNPPHHNAFGSLLHHMHRKNLIEHVGYTKSQRPERNGGLIRVWRVR